MDAAPRFSWIRAAMVVGVAYLVIGRVFAVPVNNVRMWRLAAWVVSGAVFAAQIGYEHFRLRDSPRATASHAAVAAAIGAFGLAVAGAIHSLFVSSAIQLSWLLAFVIWPVATAVPAFLVAFVAGTLLTRVVDR